MSSAAIRRSSSAAMAFAALMGLLMSSTPARAADLEGALAELKAGASYFEKGEYLTAIAHYERARALAPDAPGPNRELGKAYDKARRLPEAASSFRRYLELKPDAKDAGRIGKRLSKIEAKLAAEWTPVSVTSDPPGARLLIKGTAVGTTPVKALWLRPGTHRLRLELDGYEALEHSLVAVAGKAAPVNVVLLEVRPAPAPDPGVDPAAATPVTTPTAGVTTSVAPKRKKKSPWIWIGVTAGIVVALGAAAAVTVVVLARTSSGVPEAELPPLRP